MNQVWEKQKSLSIEHRDLRLLWPTKIGIQLATSGSFRLVSGEQVGVGTPTVILGDTIRHDERMLMGYHQQYGKLYENNHGFAFRKNDL